MKKQLKNVIKVTDDFTNEERIILRDHLALERTKLANERTLLSYLRASLYLFLGGSALIGLNHEVLGNLKWVGNAGVFFSVLFLVIGIYRFVVLKKHLKKFVQ
ncbi:DUF202 domain-containing protein [Psychroflexus salis]|uniref:DUF202 domain-containing protein n=1 Tax=Psychroflexus salis TaxID=1526574 RepID=A0A916ZSC9_9FLAO|nr:DUF202 domain-containing protein [Psychroflexus salis]GGE11972.1 hypothetical protein GCM10010831_11760 [Psychroflexus salis]